MALWELDEFQGPAFLGYVRGVPAPEAFTGERYLPNRTIDDLAFEYIKGVRNRAVMAHVMGFDSEAPIEGRPGLGERVQGELPPIKRKAKFSEKEIIRFLQPRAGTADRQTAINSVYDVTDRLLESIQARVEWLRIQALAEDTVVYDEGGVIFEFDYGINDDLQFDIDAGTNGSGAVPGLSGAPWSDHANATVHSDLVAIQAVARAEAQEFATMVVSPETFAHVLANQEMRDLIRGPGSPSTILTAGEVSTLLAQYGLPQFEVYRADMVRENADGTRTTVRPLAANKSFLLPAGGSVGNTLWGPTAESRSLIGTNAASQAPGIIAVTYATEEPPAEWVKAAAVAFPTMPDAHLLGQVTTF